MNKLGIYSILILFVVGIGSAQAATPQAQRGRLVRQIYKPVRTLDGLSAQYRAEIRKEKANGRQIAAERGRLVSEHQSPWLSRDAQVSGEYEALGKAGRVSSERVEALESNLWAVGRVRSELAGVLKTTLRDGSSERRYSAKVRRFRSDADGSWPVAAASFASKGDRFTLKASHTPGREPGRTVMPGYYPLSVNGAEVDLSRSEIMVRFSGHYAGSGSPTTVVKTFSLSPKVKDAYRVVQVKKD